MTPCELIDVQLESFFGSSFPQKIQRLVDNELNEGQWVDGYDVAASRDVIGEWDARQLLEIVLAQNADLRIDADSLMKAVDKQWPQIFSGLTVRWIVDESGSFALTDSLRVARFDGASMVWRSARISWDGIRFDSLVDGKLCGRAFRPDLHKSDWSSFVFDFSTGELLEGSIIDI